ncbi:hypothetical protein PMIN05_007390 [Paraphaeosphaeria minitans]
MDDQAIAAVIHDQGELAEMDEQLRKLQLRATDQIEHLKLAVEMCAQTLKENAATHSELLLRFTRLQKKYKALNVGQPSGENVVKIKSYVMVLVDAHSHKFKDGMISDRSKGGPLAARLLREAVGEYLLTHLPDLSQTRIIVQTFANLKQLSTDALKQGLLDSRSPSLATFASGFSGRVDSDFIDVQDKAVIRNKITKRLQDCVEDSSCVQVFLAAAGCGLFTESFEHVVDYEGQVTLILTGFNDQEQSRLALPSVSFPTVFRTLNIDLGVAARGYVRAGKDLKGADQVHSNAMIRKHLDADLAKASYLPSQSPPGLIPVNSKNERLDLYTSERTPKELSAYRVRAHIREPCAFYHLGQGCQNVPCEYSHDPLGPDALYCLQFILRGFPCVEGSSCQRLDCFRGHVCQKDGCLGTAANCNMKKDLHLADLRISEYVKPRADKIAVENMSVPNNGDLIDLF